MANQPPFKIPLTIKNGNRYRWVERKIPDISDGDRSKWPIQNENYRNATHEFYLCHLGQKWAVKDGIDETGVHYYIDKLPQGYAMFETDQYGGPQVYKRLFGHPTGRFYDSALKFEPHFLWLMSEMSGDCECVLCGKKPFVPRPRNNNNSANGNAVSKKLPIRRSRHSLLDEGDDDDDDEDTTSEWSSSTKSVTATTTRKPRNKQQSKQQVAVDEEGNEDIYQDCLKQLYNARDSKKSVRIKLEEKGSIDWIAERSSLPQYLTQVEQQHVFIPRIGELVLWCPTFPENSHLMFDFDTSEYKFFSFKEKKFCGFPQWRAGVIAAVPSNLAKGEAVDFHDMISVRKKHAIFSNVGFRVETMPDPNNDFDKSLSKQYKHVPLRNIRPLAQWQLLLRGNDASQLHESVAYALTCMTTVSLLEKWLFLGDWPNGSIFCRGIYLGSELITVGDTVRIANTNAHTGGHKAVCSDVLIISSIRYNLEGISDENASNTRTTLASRTHITLVGRAYTNDLQRAYRSATVSIPPATGSSVQSLQLPLSKAKELFRCVGANEYGPWYPLHSPTQNLEVSHEKVFGRLYEADAVQIWLGNHQLLGHVNTSKPVLDFDVESIIAGRAYATASDGRLPEAERPTSTNWYIADTRAEGLALASMNDIDLGRYHSVRDAETLRYWRNAVKIADGCEIGSEPAKEVAMASGSEMKKRRGRPVGSKVVNGRLVLPGKIQPRDENISGPREELKTSSQLAGAALASDSEDPSDEGEDFGYDHTYGTDGSADSLRG